MTRTDERVGAHRGAIRFLLLALGIPQTAIGLWALVGPHGFYDQFPTGQGWVRTLGPFDEHLVIDVGALFVAIGVLAILASVWLRRPLVIAAALSWLLFSVPHTIWHLTDLGPMSTGDAIANVVTLAGTVLAPLLVLALLRAPARVGRDAPAAANGSRVPGVQRSRNPIVRSTFWTTRRKYGKVVEPVRVFAHHPLVMVGYGAFELATERAKLVPDRLKALGEMKAAQLAGCEWCLDFGSALSRHHGITDDELRDLLDYRASARFSEVEKLVLDYAVGISRTPVDVPDELFARLREHFDDAQMVELTSVIALENYRARFNWAMGIQGEGFSEGAYCVRPSAPAAQHAPARSG
ncbi:MAG: carboxymuconolactone decarboxylase family protein [Actinomycetota bacterium]|nr:carboxymuconolactone decarboxylase family protein [Actinomycetota bacterium]